MKLSRPARLARIPHTASRLALCALIPTLTAFLSPAHAQRPRGGNPFAAPLATTHSARVRDYHVQHMKLIFDVNAQDHSAHGIVTHTLASLRPTLDKIVLDARENLNIEACTLDGKEVPFAHEKDILTLTPATPLTQGKVVKVEIRYMMPNSRTRGGANGAGGFKWIDPTPNSPERRPGFWTQGETNTNSAWVPCYDFPNDKCTSETIVTVPDNWQVIGNGTESPVVHDAAKHTSTFHWTMTQPHSTYLLSLVGGELDVQKGNWRGVPLYYVVPKGQGGRIPASFGNTPDMLSFFSDLLGVKYAWPKYAQCAVYDFPGGMENVSATTLGNFLIDARSERFQMSSLTSHELAHQWFGDLVTCEDWGDAWLNESFATFFEMLYVEHEDGKETYDSECDKNLRSYLQSATRVKHALSTSFYRGPDDMFESGHTYAKGGVILNMLRRELGDKALFRALGHYLKKYRYQPVNATNLEQAISEDTGKDVKPFFDQWIRKPGHPILDVTWQYDDATKEVVANVKQTQDTADGTPIYTMPLTFATLVDGNLGSDTSNGGLASGNVKLKTFTMDKPEQEFRWKVSAKPDSLVFDPNHDLVKEVKDTHWSEAELPVILRQSPSYLDRRSAAFALGRKATLEESTAKLFVTALKTESSDSVAAYMLTRLGSTKNESLRPLFREQAHAKQTARRAAAIDALAGLPANDDDTKLLRALASSDTEPYRVVNAALYGLGKLNAEANVDVLKHQAAQTSQRDLLAATCVDIVGSKMSEMFVPVLVAATAPNHSVSTRTDAAKAIGTLSPGNAEVHAALIDMLKDTRPAIQQAAIEALSARNDKDALPMLKTLAGNADNKTVQDAATTAVTELEKP